jgi:hypothetical protein
MMKEARLGWGALEGAAGDVDRWDRVRGGVFSWFRACAGVACPWEGVPCLPACARVWGGVAGAMSAMGVALVRGLALSEV